jgi:uncharacterized membrane protein YbhN (UPF0104 family)
MTATTAGRRPRAPGPSDAAGPAVAPTTGLTAWALARRVVVGGVIVGGVVAVLGTHRDLLRAGLSTLVRSCPAWVVAAVALECASLVAFALLQRRLLGAGGAPVRLRSVMCTVVNADAIATSVPVAGSGLAMAFAYRDFRRMGADAPTATTTPLLSTAMSTATFVVLVAAGAAVSGNAGVAALGGFAVVVAVAVAVGLRLALRSMATRGGLPAGLSAVLQRIGADRADRVIGFLDRCAGLRLSRGALGYAVLCAAGRWTADALCLVAAIEATGGRVPWAGLLLAWAAGAATTTLGLTPGGIGAADAVLGAALIGVGLSPAGAAAAVVLYRLIALKLLPRAAWFAYRRRLA